MDIIEDDDPISLKCLHHKIASTAQRMVQELVDVNKFQASRKQAAKPIDIPEYRIEEVPRGLWLLNELFLEDDL